MSQTVVTVDVGGTGANNANAALTNLGALPTFGGSITGNLNVSNNIVVTGNANLGSFILQGNTIFNTLSSPFGDITLVPNNDRRLLVRSKALFGNVNGYGADIYFFTAGIDESTVAIGSVADLNSAAEILAVNRNSGTLAYSEFIAINDAGDQDSGWISIGVNSSNYDDPEYTLTGPDDGYLLFEPPQGTAANGDLIIGTGSFGLNNKIILAAGGFTPSDAQLIVAPADLKRANLVSYSVSSNVVTFVTDITHTFVANDIVSISDVGAPYDGTRTITAVTSNTLNVSVTTGDIGSVNLSPPGFALQFLPFNKGTVELTAQLFVGENSKSTIETANLTLSEGFAVPLGVVVNNDGPGQVSMFNKSNGALAYTEFIAQNDAADADMGWVSFGINSSGYDDPEFPITKADDAYLLYEPPAGTTGDGDLIIGTGTNGSKNRLIFAAEGFDEANAQMIITPNESVRIAIPTDASSSNTGALQVVGGVGVQGSMYVQGNQTIQGDLIVNGSQVIQSINELTASGPISLLSDGNIANTWDQGLVGTYAVSKASVTEDIAFKEIANNTATLTTSNNHSFLVEDYVVVANVDATFDGTHRITAVSSNTFSYFKLANNLTQTAATGTGTVDKSAKYTGVVKRASDGAWRVFSNLGTRPDFNTDFADANLVYDSIIAGEGTFNGSLKLGTPNTATITYTDANNRTLSIPALTGDRTFAFLNEPQTFTAAQAFSSTVTGTKFIPTAGDATGNGLYLAGTNKLALSADGVERISISASETVINDGGNDYDFRVESDGDANMLLVDGGLNRVGIGTGAPEQTLHVQGNTYISGSVGIGTTAPSYPLDVSGGSGLIAQFKATGGLGNYAGVFADTSTNTGGGYFAVGKNGTRYGVYGTSGAWIGDTTTDVALASESGSNIRFYTNGSSTERMRITSSGSVGIGTTNPNRMFDIYGTGDSSMRMKSTNASGVAYVFYFDDSDRVLEIAKYGTSRTDSFCGVTLGGWSMIADRTANSNGLVIGTSGSKPLVLGTENAERMRIAANGNVGIGTSSPSKKLHIYTSDNEGIFLQGTGTGIWMDIKAGGSSANIHSIGGEDSGLGFYNRTQSQYRMFLTNDGNFGIGGTKTPQSKLHVIGNIETTTSSSLHSETSWYSIDNDHNIVRYKDNNEVYIEKATNFEGYGFFTLYPETVGRNFDVSFRLQGGTPGATYRHVAIAIRSDGTNTTNNYDYIVFRYNPSNNSLNQIRIDVAGVTQQSLESSSVPNWYDGNVRHVIIRCRGGVRYEVEVDGTLIHTMTASAQTRSRGRIGFAIYEGTDSNKWLKIKDFHVTNLPEWENSLYIQGSSGIVTMPNQPAWNLRPNTGTNVTINGSEIIGWSSSTSGASSKTCFIQGVTLSGSSGGTAGATSTGRLTFPVAGKYKIWVTVRAENTPGTGNIYLYINGVRIARQHVEIWGSGNGYPYAHGFHSHVIDVAANDYLEIEIACSGLVMAGYNDTVNWFGGHLIG